MHNSGCVMFSAADTGRNCRPEEITWQRINRHMHIPPCRYQVARGQAHRLPSRRGRRHALTDTEDAADRRPDRIPEELHTMTAAYAGVFPIAPTPFTQSGELDLDGMRRVLDCMIDQKAVSYTHLTLPTNREV